MEDRAKGKGKNT